MDELVMQVVAQNVSDRSRAFCEARGLRPTTAALDQELVRLSALLAAHTNTGHQLARDIAVKAASNASLAAAVAEARRERAISIEDNEAHRLRIVSKRAEKDALLARSEQRMGAFVERIHERGAR